ncbi:phosphoglucosamine mutase [Candidatus Poribacteria bacterium]|nr:phosphoglucosamine mutase [Candidatus Poribacteria bacterium]MYA57696.1 phosphoglucosamine mutase [Candidatus Poribacteria bacterium]
MLYKGYREDCMGKAEKPIVSVSGVRGEVGVSLDVRIITQFAMAFGTFVGGRTVIIGRDSRTSSPTVRHAVLAGLFATGCHVIDVGLCPTPTILLMAKALGAQGSITITASHNPVAWNGIEFASNLGHLLTQTERDELMRIYAKEDFALTPWNEQGTLETCEDAVGYHLDQILSSAWLAPDLIRKAALKVVIDAGNGAGSVISPPLLRRLGCRVVALNCVADGHFRRPAEPTPEVLDELCKTVVASGADIGFAHDGDADRLVVVTERGVPLSGEWTLAFIADFMLRKTKGDVVATVSTSRMLDDIVAKHGVALHRTKVGVGWVVEKMHAVKAAIGGEGTGGVIYPNIHYTTDGITSIAAIAQYLAESGVSVTQLVENMPHYQMCRKKLEIPSQELAERLVDLALEVYKEACDAGAEPQLELTDGVKRVWKDRWVNIRPSGTEPVIRVFSEAPTFTVAEQLCDETMETLKVLMKQIS